MKNDMRFNDKDIVRVVYIDKLGEEQSLTKQAQKDGRGKVYLSISISTKTGMLYCLYAGQDYDSIVSIDVIEKFYHEASFAGSNARICDLITDSQNNVLFVRLCGQEDMVRSITAVIMQGRMKMNDHFLNFSSFNVKVFSGGMKRLLKPIGSGMVDCILYHRSLVPDIGMSALFHTENSCLESFQKFLQILPIPRIYRLDNGNALEKEIMDQLFHQEILTPANTLVGCLTVSCVDIVRLTENDYSILRDAIVETLEKRGYVQTPIQETTTASNYHSVIPTYLNECPEYGKTDGHKFKKVYAKFFSPSMTWYITEYERETDICYGYVENLSDPNCSDWGTFYHKELAEFKNRYPFYYIERDLYLNNETHIDMDGTLYDYNPGSKVA